MSELITSIAHDKNGGGTENIKLFTGESILLRYENGWNENVDIDIEATVEEDKANFNNSEELRGNADANTEGTLTVNSGTTDSDFLTEPWDIIRVDVTPASDPTSGNFDLRVMRSE